jgi:hypothetical protein
MAIAKASRVRGQHAQQTPPSPALARLRLRSDTLSHKGRGEESERPLLQSTSPPKNAFAPVLGGGRFTQPGADGGERFTQYLKAYT